MRFQQRDIPSKPYNCNRKDCVYNRSLVCDEPRLNHGNSDAKCFYLTPKAVIEMLIPIVGEKSD